MRIGGPVAVFVLSACAALAQQGGYSQQPSTYGQPQGGQTQPNTYGQQNIPPDATRKPPRNKPKPPPSKDEILRDASALTKSAPLACDVTDAALLNDGTATINGQNLHVRTFETACSNGMGYLLVEQPPEKTMGFSCFAADATRAHAPDGGGSTPACTLPANADRKAMAGAVLGKLGMPCQVTDIRWVGQETGVGAELTEAACAGGTGYVIRSALPGAAMPVSAMSCPDSYRRGVACKLSSNGPPLVTVQTLKDALVQHHVNCAAEVVRPIGRESLKQRYVAEFKCPAQFPGGLVALIPLEGNTAPFETLDCAQAAARLKTVCVLTPQK